jgi:hypothetical protein
MAIYGYFELKMLFIHYFVPVGGVFIGLNLTNRFMKPLDVAHEFSWDRRRAQIGYFHKPVMSGYSTFLLY